MSMLIFGTILLIISIHLGILILLVWIKQAFRVPNYA